MRGKKEIDVLRIVEEVHRIYVGGKDYAIFKTEDNRFAVCWGSDMTSRESLPVNFEPNPVNGVYFYTTIDGAIKHLGNLIGIL